MAQFCLVRFDGDADKRTTFDVVNMTRVVSKEDDGPCEGSQVQVRWRDKGLFKATLIAISEDRPELIKEMDKAIADYNRQAMADPKKNKDRQRRSQDLVLLQELQNTDVSSLRKENASLRKENEKLREELKKYKQLDGYLKSAEALVKELSKCTSYQSRGEVEEEKRAAAKKMGAIDRPAVLKQIVSVTLPTPAGARGPQQTCDPHHKSPDLRVTPHLQAEQEQGPCWASRTSSCSPACPAAEDRPVYSCSPGGPKQGNLVLGQPRSCCSVGVTLMLWNCSRGAQSLLRHGHFKLCSNQQKHQLHWPGGLLPAVFNKQALLTCSMKGQKAKGGTQARGPTASSSRCCNRCNF
ncbi:hypothetical protein MRX96_050180, partial [Rhipicephalus microplus]